MCLSNKMVVVFFVLFQIFLWSEEIRAEIQITGVNIIELRGEVFMRTSFDTEWKSISKNIKEIESNSVLIINEEANLKIKIIYLDTAYGEIQEQELSFQNPGLVSINSELVRKQIQEKFIVSEVPDLPLPPSKFEKKVKKEDFFFHIRNAWRKLSGVELKRDKILDQIEKKETVGKKADIILISPEKVFKSAESFPEKTKISWRASGVKNYFIYATVNDREKELIGVTNQSDYEYIVNEPGLHTIEITDGLDKYSSPVHVFVLSKIKKKKVLLGKKGQQNIRLEESFDIQLKTPLENYVLYMKNQKESEIFFSWIYTGDSLTQKDFEIILHILDEKREVIFEEKLSDFQVKKNLPPGTYYWYISINQISVNYLSKVQKAEVSETRSFKMIPYDSNVEIVDEINKILNSVSNSEENSIFDFSSIAVK